MWRELFTRACGAGDKARVNNSRHICTLQNVNPNALLILEV
jgi:hypothetical protein